MVVFCGSSSPAGYSLKKNPVCVPLCVPACVPVYVPVCHIMHTCCKSATDGESADRAVGADIAA